MRRIALFAAAVVVSLIAISFQTQAQSLGLLQGVIPPSGCRVGAVLSLEHFASTGFSSVRTATPNDEYVAGAWVVANNYAFSTSILQPPNCADDLFSTPPQSDDDLGLNLMGVRIYPTISSATEADIQELKLVWDVNLNGHWDPLLDLVLQSKSGDALDSQEGALFYNGPQNPLAVLSDTQGFLTPFDQCNVFAEDSEVNNFRGPRNGTNSRFDITPDGTEGCFIGLLAVVRIGDTPRTGTQLGLALEAFAGDIPGSNGSSTHQISSGFSSSRNPQASNIRLQMVGGNPSSHTPLEHLSNSSGNVESHVETLTFTGGNQGEGLLSRFRAQRIIPGTREAIAIAVAICDGGALANTNASILPLIPGAVPQIAGGLRSLPCIPSQGTDGFATGINGATLIFRGPLSRYMGTVRMYADECSESAAIESICLPGFLDPPTTTTVSGGGDGFLFQPGELAQSVVPSFNAGTGEAIARFGGRQDQILLTTNGNPIANGSDPICNVDPTCPAFGAPQRVGSTPLILIFTVDIDSNAPPGEVDVVLGLESYDDTGLSLTGCVCHPCFVYFVTAHLEPFGQGGFFGDAGVCASNFLDLDLERSSFTVEALDHPVAASSVDNIEMCGDQDEAIHSLIESWETGLIAEREFYAGLDQWVNKGVCESSVNSIESLRLSKATHKMTAFGTMEFNIEGHAVSNVAIEIFSLDGRPIYSDSSKGHQLFWNLTSQSGSPVANGTYLYVAKVRDSMGNLVESDVKKLRVIR